MDPHGRFDVRHWFQKQERKPTTVRMGQPRELTCWTRASVTDASRPMEYQHKDRSGLLAFCVPQLPASLGEGYPDAFVQKPSDDHSGVETVLEAAQLASVPLGEYNFATYRNNLNKIFLTPLNTQDAWTVDGCRIGRTMFLDIVKTPQKDFPNAKLFEFFGYKFEALCTAEKVVDSSSEFGSVVHLHLGDHRLIVGAEIDCYDPQLCPAGEQAPLSSYVEMKTFRLPQTAQQTRNLMQFKYPRWWVQSWLAGVPRIAAGARDDQGQLLQVDLVDTQALPRLAREAGASWQPHQLLAFGHDVLAWMRHMGSQHPEQHLRFSYDPSKRQIVCTPADQATLTDRLRKVLDQ